MSGWGILCPWLVTVTVTPVSPGVSSWEILYRWLVGDHQPEWSYCAEQLIPRCFLGKKRRKKGLLLMGRWEETTQGVVPVVGGLVLGVTTPPPAAGHFQEDFRVWRLRS